MVVKDTIVMRKYSVIDLIVSTVPLCIGVQIKANTKAKGTV